MPLNAKEMSLRPFESEGECRVLVRYYWLMAICALWLGGGCSRPPQFRENALEWYKQEKAARFEPGQSFAASHRRDVADVTTAWFGTPDEPFFPFLDGEEDPAVELISTARLNWAAGPVVSQDETQSAGLYRRHCAHCHGVTGDGAGPTAAFLSPYPRDFRLGKFKFKSSTTGTPPTKAELLTVLRNGVPGTSMPSFRLLKDEELEALADYVVYLSIRGTVERLLIGAVRELGDDERLVMLPDGKTLSQALAEADAGSGDSAPNSSETPAAKGGTEESPTDETEETEPGPDTELDMDRITEDLDYLTEDHFLPVLEKWLGSLDGDASDLEVPAWVQDRQHPEFGTQVSVGRGLYFGKANCVQCHGETGLGDGQTNNYDDWTNDWLKVEGIDPTNPEAWAPYVNAGAMPPRPILPRNLRLGVYRGGDRPDDIFYRIRNGIEGTPMPASLTLTEDEVWALVAYVRQLPFERLSRPETGRKQENDKFTR
jgi:mono/diheme cytochrome c family protein